MNSFLFVISALAIFAGTQAFDPVEWCSKRATSRNFVQFKANPDNLTEYFQCDKTRTGFVAHKLACHKCFIFSDDLWTCVKVESGDCEPTEAPITEVITYDSKWCYVKGNGPAGLYLQLFRQGSVRYKYIWDIGGGAEVEMSCPPGTFFDFVQCRCIWCDGGECAIASNRVFTLDFDHSDYQNGIYFDFEESLKFVLGPSLLAAKFDGVKNNIEVPFFQNNEFSQFTFVVSFVRDSGVEGLEPILYNGGNPIISDFRPPSIYVNIAASRQVVAGIQTDQGSYEVTSGVVLADDVWASLILRYNGVKLELWVNGVYDSADASGVTLRLKDDLKIGQSFDAAGNSYFFKGLIDDLSWYRTAIKVPIENDDKPPNQRAASSSSSSSSVDTKRR